MARTKKKQGSWRARKTRSPKVPIEPPTTGVIMGVVVDACRLRATPSGEALARKTATRWFKGERIKPATQAEFLRCIAAALVERRYLPELFDVDAVSSALMHAVDKWARIGAAMRSHSVPVRRTGLMTFCYLRLVVVDLALRWAALATLERRSIPEVGEERPLWSTQRSVAELLSSWIRAAASHPTRDRLAERLGYSRNTVDDWLSGNKQPTDKSIQDLATYFGDTLEQDSMKCEVALMRRAAVGAMCTLLDRHLSSEHYAQMLWSGLAALANRGREQLGALFEVELIIAPGIDRAMLPDLIVRGVEGVLAERLVRELWELEPNRGWRAELAASLRPWESRLQQVARHLGLAPKKLRAMVESRGPADASYREMTKLLFEDDATYEMLLLMGISDMTSWNTHDADGFDGEFMVMPQPNWAKCNNRLVQADQQEALGNHAAARVHYRRAVELDPTNYEARFFLGANLGMHANELFMTQPGWFPEVVDAVAREAFEHLRACAELKPRWDRPVVEIGIILHNIGFPLRALEYFRSIEQDIDIVDGHYFNARGISAYATGQLEDARRSFEAVLEFRPQHAEALCHLSRCLLCLGDRRGARRYAKQAEELGAGLAMERLEGAKRARLQLAALREGA